MVRIRWNIIHAVRPRSAGEILEILLRNRHIGASSLNATLKDLESYLSICGLTEGAELMAEHLAAGNKIVLIGDYDCDGVTSAAQLSLFLRDIGYGNFDVIIPMREEGYGIPERAVTEHPDAKLFVAMDCGTLERDRVSSIRSLGADCIVIDHHEAPQEKLAPATILINPKQAGCSSSFKELCSSGLTLLFLTRLRRAINGRFPSPHLGGKYLILAAVGTVADLVPLTEANRILTQSGLCAINNGGYPPIQQIIDAAGLSRKPVSAGHIGYYIGPRLNAAGRMADAKKAFTLLVAEETREIEDLAKELNRLNAKRQRMEESILGEIRERYAGLPKGRRSVVMADPRWSPGIVGIVASRIQQELHYGPVIILSMDEGTGTARGSARSIPGFDIHGALRFCDDLLLKWGGHKMAAGMTIEAEKLDLLAERLEEYAQTHAAELFVPQGKVDMELDLGLVTPELVETLKKLEPHGLGNPTPVFASRGMRVSIEKVFGRERNHLELMLGEGTKGVFWKGARHPDLDSCRNGSQFDVIFHLEWDHFRKEPVLNIKDIGHFF